jgi:hypothetical protein
MMYVGFVEFDGQIGNRMRSDGIPGMKQRIAHSPDGRIDRRWLPEEAGQ